MAEVIRKGSAAKDVIADLRKALENAHARGGTWNTVAEEKLRPVERLATMVEGRLTLAEQELAPLVAAVNAHDDVSDDLLGAASDDIWNKVGRPASDPVLSIMFPGGVAWYTGGADEDQPDKMLLLAEFLDAGLHPKLDAATSHTHATAIRASATRYRELIEAVRAPAARVKMLGAMYTAVGRFAQTELANLKRRYKSDGFSDSDIHGVIPAHTRAAAAPKSPDSPVTPTPVTPTPATPVAPTPVTGGGSDHQPR